MPSRGQKFSKNAKPELFISLCRPALFGCTVCHYYSLAMCPLSCPSLMDILYRKIKVYDQFLEKKRQNFQIVFDHFPVFFSFRPKIFLSVFDPILGENLGPVFWPVFSIDIEQGMGDI